MLIVHFESSTAKLFNNLLICNNFFSEIRRCEDLHENKKGAKQHTEQGKSLFSHLRLTKLSLFITKLLVLIFVHIKAYQMTRYTLSSFKLIG